MSVVSLLAESASVEGVQVNLEILFKSFEKVNGTFRNTL